ncbi:MAG: hypothetical protein RLY83_799 [Actinomycetota bacterium]|jgi:hypothetical protein
MAKTKNEEVIYETEVPKAAKTEKSAPRAKYDFTNLNTLAIVSIASAVTGFGAAAAVITGHVSLAQIKKSGQAGRGFAIAGIAAGYTVIGLWILASIGMVAINIWGARHGVPVGGFGRIEGGPGMMGFDRDGDQGGQFQMPMQPQIDGGTVTVTPQQ